MFLQKQMRLLDQECCQRWNFDFQKDSPLPGRYEWTPADCGDVSSDPPARQCDAAVQTCDESGTDAAADTDADTGCQLRNEMCPAPSRHPQQPAAAVITVAVQCGQAVEPEDKETTCTPTATAADPAKGCGSKRKRIITGKVDRYIYVFYPKFRLLTPRALSTTIIVFNEFHYLLAGYIS